MTSKRTGWLFLTIILVHLGVVVVLTLAGGFSIGIVTNFLLSQGIVLVPTLLFLFAFELPYRRMVFVPAGDEMVPAPHQMEAAGFHKVRISTLLMIALCTFLLMPLVTVLNALTMFFTDNTMVAMEGDILATPFLVMLFMIGIFGPFCEEFVFRGVIYKSFARSSGWGIAPVLLSALLFGLMHMNFNQALYAFGIGVFLALMVEAAGSLWASVFCHMFFNSIQVVMMYVSGFLLDSVFSQAVEETAQSMTTQELMAALSVWLVIAAVTTPIAVCVVFWVAKHEGRAEAFSSLFRVSKKQPVQPVMQDFSAAPVQQPAPEPLLSVPLIVAIVFCFGYMSLELLLL